MGEIIFTVIITTYRRLEYLKNALESVLSQDFKKFECLVINDYPPDNQAISLMIHGLNDERFVFVESLQNKGGNYCRNKGITMAKGNYVAFLDDDDVWFPDKLHVHYEQHQETGAALVYSGYIRKEYGRPESEVLIKGPEVPDDIPKAMFKGKFSIGTTSSVSLNRTVIPDSLFDEELESFQDWDAWLSLAIRQKNVTFFHIREPLLYFIHHEEDRITKNVIKREKGLQQILQKYGGKPKMKGFYYKELMNINLLKTAEYDRNLWNRKKYLLKEFIQYPGLWFRKYPARRMIKYFLLGR